MDWASIIKGVISLGLSFGTGWGTAVMSDVSGEKAVASGVVAAAAWWLGNRQNPVRISKE